MPFKPPLTTVDLKAIQERNPENADVRALLWEIKRMRAQRLREYQLRGCWSANGGPMRQVLDAHLADMMLEPVILEQETPFYGEEVVQQRAEAAADKVAENAAAEAARKAREKVC